MKFIEYAEHVQAPEYVLTWVRKNIKDTVATDEGEHVIDYLVSKDAPTRLESANYEDTKGAADKWLKAQIKKGKDIIETDADTETALDFGDGFKIVRLVGENAYKREGFLMSHCCGGYYGRNVEVYSLRDKDNMPHCTLEKDKQIKGKGNGDIHPRYIDYVVKFLEHTGMTVNDNEMAHLGYVNIENIKDENAVFDTTYLYRQKYFRKDMYEKITDKEGSRYQNLTLWDVFGLFSFKSDMTVKMHFDVRVCRNVFKKSIEALKEVVSNGNYNEVAMANYNEVAMAYYNEVAMANSNKVAMADHNKVAMANSNKVAMANYNKVAMAHSNKVAMADHNKVAMANSNKVAMANYNKVAMANYNEVAMAHYNKVAMANYNEVAMAHSNKVAMADYNKVAMADSNEVVAGEVCTLAGGIGNTVTIGNKSIGVLGNESKVQGKIGACFVLFERDNDNNIKSFLPFRVDGVDVKEDVFYTLKDGILVEADK